MSNLLERVKSLFNDRRTRNEPVAVERRAKHKRKDVDDRLRNAVEDFDQTIKMTREDFLEKFSANDIQQTTTFSTFRMICNFTLKAGQHRLCRHPKHEAANTGIAKCEEQVCPFMLGKVG